MRLPNQFSTMEQQRPTEMPDLICTCDMIVFQASSKAAEIFKINFDIGALLAFLQCFKPIQPYSCTVHK